MLICGHQLDKEDFKRDQDLNIQGQAWSVITYNQISIQFFENLL